MLGCAELFASELLALAYIAAIAKVAVASGALYVLFPELGALSYDALSRPQGRWGSAPLHLATSPVLTAVLGTVITRAMPYGFWSVMFVVIGSGVIILVLRSPIAPAISAGFLPLVLGVKSWWYPPGILFGTILLVLISISWRFLLSRWRPAAAFAPGTGAKQESEAHRSQMLRLIPLVAFVAVAAALVKLTGLRFLLFPPLVVIGFEMVRHPESCAWVCTPIRLPLACTVTAATGLLFWHLCGPGMAGAALSMGAGIIVLRALDLHVPPALAVALLPMVMDSPTISFPVAVALGTSCLALWFTACRHYFQPALG